MIRVQGAAEVIGALANAGKQALVRSDGAVGEVARETATDAASRAPRLTGALAESISADRIARARWEVGSPLRYSGFVEFGTFKDAPQPYLAPAVDAHREDLAARILRNGAPW